jgi:hypothetical protein
VGPERMLLVGCCNGKEIAFVLLYNKIWPPTSSSKKIYFEKKSPVKITKNLESLSRLFVCFGQSNAHADIILRL